MAFFNSGKQPGFMWPTNDEILRDQMYRQSLFRPRRSKRLTPGTYQVGPLTVHVPPRTPNDQMMADELEQYLDLLEEAREDDFLARTRGLSSKKVKEQAVEKEIAEWAKSWQQRLNLSRELDLPLDLRTTDDFDGADAYVTAPTDEELKDPKWKCADWGRSCHPPPAEYWRCPMCLQNLTGDQLCSPTSDSKSTSGPPSEPTSATRETGSG